MIRYKKINENRSTKNFVGQKLNVTSEWNLEKVVDEYSPKELAKFLDRFCEESNISYGSDDESYLDLAEDVINSYPDDVFPMDEDPDIWVMALYRKMKKYKIAEICQGMSLK